MRSFSAVSLNRSHIPAILALAAVTAGLLSSKVLAQNVPAASAAAPIMGASVPKQLRINIAWQIALEAADFSPGILDGVFKRKSLMALNEYAARSFPGLSPFDPQVYTALNVDVDHA